MRQAAEVVAAGGAEAGAVLALFASGGEEEGEGDSYVHGECGEADHVGRAPGRAAPVDMGECKRSRSEYRGEHDETWLELAQVEGDDDAEDDAGGEVKGAGG